jgi:hypothetical protein
MMERQESKTNKKAGTVRHLVTEEGNVIDHVGP